MNVSDSNCVLTNYYQHGPASIQQSVYNELLVVSYQQYVVISITVLYYDLVKQKFHFFLSLSMCKW